MNFRDLTCKTNHRFKHILQTIAKNFQIFSLHAATSFLLSQSIPQEASEDLHTAPGTEEIGAGTSNENRILLPFFNLAGSVSKKTPTKPYHVTSTSESFPKAARHNSITLLTLVPKTRVC